MDLNEARLAELQVQVSRARQSFKDLWKKIEFDQIENVIGIDREVSGGIYAKVGHSFVCPACGSDNTAFLIGVDGVGNWTCHWDGVIFKVRDTDSKGISAFELALERGEPHAIAAQENIERLRRGEEPLRSESELNSVREARARRKQVVKIENPELIRYKEEITERIRSGELTVKQAARMIVRKQNELS
jgi:predicted DNA-binding protein